MEAYGVLINGFYSALTPLNIGMAFIGAVLGTLVGVLPGLGPTSAIAILLPLTGVLPPASAIIMFAGIYYGAMYGGSTTAILLNIPGEVASVPTVLDGYPLAQQGRGGPALGIAAIGSFIGGTFSIIGLTLFAPFLAEKALSFGPPEYFSLMLLALSVIVGLCGQSIIRGLIVGSIGYLLSMIGLGPTMGLERFTYGSLHLFGGLDLISIVIGVFAISEVFIGIEETRLSVAPKIVGSVFPTLNDYKRSIGAICRGSFLGFFLGLLPGCSPAVTTFLSYDLEKKVSKNPERFGKGAIEGVAAPETCNNATSSAGFIPLFVLGIPASPPLAVLLGGLMIYGLQPGPVFFIQNSGFVWTIIASMYIGNIMLLILNLPLIGMWAKVTLIPYGILSPIILIFCIIGAFTMRNNLFDVGISLVFGFIGYIMHKYEWPNVPLILCYILGPMLERSFVQSMAMSGGRPEIFFTRGMSLGLLISAITLLIISIKLTRRTGRRISQEVKKSGEL